MRRDQPDKLDRATPKQERSPHAQGSTGNAHYRGFEKAAFPACAGINQIQPVVSRLAVRVPRMRRDQPPPFTKILLFNRVPRMRRDQPTAWQP